MRLLRQRPSARRRVTERLQEIRQRLDAATPGDWPFGELARHLLPADADLIAHAPADIAWLLDRIEALQYVVESQRIKAVES